jgi:DNA end-binding protein Ku
MGESGKVALAKFVMRGKENLVLIRSSQNGLMLHTMYFADEVRDFKEIEKGESAKISSAETSLAKRLIDELSNDQFKPEAYEDEYRQRVLDLVNTKAEGKEITVVEPGVKRAQVIDLMEALKESLGKKQAREKKPAIQAKLREPEKSKKKAQSSKK